MFINLCNIVNLVFLGYRLSAISNHQILNSISVRILLKSNRLSV